MYPTYILTGADLHMLLDVLRNRTRPVHKLSVAIDGGAKFKVNEGTWSPPLGTLRTD